MSPFSIRRVAIVGAGATGSALAAHLTNLGFSVSLIDLTSQLATVGIDHLRTLLYVPERAGEVRVLGMEEAASALGDCDWIVEAVPERIEAKRSVYATIAAHLRPDAIVTTCSPSFPIEELSRDLPDGFLARFMGANFTLPLGEHRLVEVRPGLDQALARSFAQYLGERVARRAIVVPDGPGGIVARYGYWCLFLGLGVAEKLRLDVEDVEEITGRFLGQIGSGIFGGIDRIGLHELRDVASNLHERLPDDRGARFLVLPNSMVGLLSRGWTGDGSGRGYFRREGRERLALNLTTMAYRQAHDAALPGLIHSASHTTTERIQSALGKRDEVGEYLREFLITALRYAEYLREAMGVSVVDLDHAMEWGFGWERGPFQLLDDLKLGATRYYDHRGFWNGERYDPLPREENVRTLESFSIVDHGDGYLVRDLGEGIEAVVLEEGVLTPSRVQALVHLLSGRPLGRLVLTSAGKDFPELDLAYILSSLRNDASSLDSYLAGLQLVGEGLENRACVAAIRGRCAGPCLGFALSCGTIVSAPEAEIGFPEARLGLVPTARGLALMRALHGASARRMGEVAVTLAEGTVSPNADLARAAGLIRPDDVTEYLPERVLETARELAKGAVPNARPAFEPVDGPLVGIIDRGLADRRHRGALTDLDVSIGSRIRQILARTVDYEECIDQERRETIELGAKALSQARLRHMIETGKPLRN